MGKRGRKAWQTDNYVVAAINMRSSARDALDAVAHGQGVSTSEWGRWALARAVAMGWTMPEHAKHKHLGGRPQRWARGANGQDERRDQS